MFCSFFRYLRWFGLLWYVCSGAGAVWAASKSEAKGQIDLRKVDWKQENIKLKGHWFFVPRLLAPSKKIRTTGMPLLKVPGPWNSERSAAGPGTYFLTIQLPNPKRKYALYINEVVSAFALYIDGRLVMRSGDVYGKKSPRFRWYPVQREVELGGTHQIMVQIVNAHRDPAGFLRPLEISSPEIRAERQTRRFLFHFVTMGGLLVIGLMWLIHWLWRPKDYGALFFAAMALVFCLRAITNEDLFSALGFIHASPLTMRLNYLTMQWVLLMVGGYVAVSFPSRFYWNFFKVFGACLVGFSLLIMTVSHLTFSSYLPQMQLLAIVGGSVTLGYGIVCTIRGEEGAMGLFTSCMILFGASFHDILFSKGLPSLGFSIGPIGILGFFVHQSYVLGRKNLEAHTTAEHLSIHLKSEVQQQTEKLSEALQEERSLHERLQKAQGELEEAVQKAKDAAETKAMFLASMSHEIRTPMNGVIGMIDFLRDTPLSKEQREYVEVMSVSGQTLLALINDVLDVSKLDSGKMVFVKEPFSIVDLVQDTVSMLLSMAQNKGLELCTYVDARFPKTLIGDANRIRQVLINALGNAIKFTEKGRVTVRCIQLERNEKDCLLRLEVHDTGIGMSEEARAKVFHLFTQADASTTSQFGGTGLGLSIAKRLVKEMKGDIGIESQEGKGSEFWCTLRLIWQEEAQSEPQFEGKRVLLIEGNQERRQSLTEHFILWGLEVDTLSGLQGLEKDRGEKWDFVVLHMDYLDAIEQLTPLGRQLFVMVPTPSTKIHALVNEQVSTISLPVRFSRIKNQFCEALGVDQEVQEEGETMQSELKGHILLVEDNVVNQLIVTKLLTVFGCEVDVAENGLRAVEMVKEHPYDLVLMDREMPEMGGIEATQAIRAWEKASHRDEMTIVAMTAHVLEEERQKSLDAGMNGFLPKPIRKDKLREVIGEYLRKVHSV